MSIKTLFRQRSDTIESLQQKYRDIASKKESLEKRADSLRAEALRSDVKDTQKQIDAVREEILLAGVALKEVQKELEAMLTKKIETDYQGLDAEKQQYESQLNELSEKSGRSLGEAVQTLQSLNLSFARNLGEQIRQLVTDFNRDHRFAKQMPIFLQAYGDSISSQTEVKNFRAWKARLKKAEKLRPGSVAAQNHIRGETKDLLRAD